MSFYVVCFAPKRSLKACDAPVSTNVNHETDQIACKEDLQEANAAAGQVVCLSMPAIVVRGEMIEYYDVSCCYIRQPWSYSIWKHIRNYMDAEIEKMGIETPTSLSSLRFVQCSN